jgi:hypothetical protein
MKGATIELLVKFGYHVTSIRGGHCRSLPSFTGVGNVEVKDASRSAGVVRVLTN